MGELEPIRNRGHHLSDNKRPMTLRGQFASRLIHLEIAPVEPDVISDLVLGRIAVFYPEFLRPDHVCLGILSYLQKIVKMPFNQWGLAGGVVSISTGVIAHQKEEWGVLRGFAPPIVVRKLC